MQKEVLIMTKTRTENTSNSKLEKISFKGDRLNIILLIYIYTLQNIPRSLASAFPLILQNRKATYTDQAWFNFVSYSFSLKLLLAPIVDCVYSRRIGRRKTWAIPMMYLIGASLLLISVNADSWLGTEDGSRKPHTRLLTIVIFVAILFSAVHDIAIDGWCFTTLKKENIGYGAISGMIAVSISFLLGFVLFIALDSKEFCNIFRSVPKDHGFITFSEFLLFWSVVIILSSTLIWLFKKENSRVVFEDENQFKLGVKESYKFFWKVLKIHSVKRLFAILLTSQVAYGAVNGLARLKLMDAGIPRDKFVLLTIPSIPFVSILPFFLRRYMTRNSSVRTYLTIYVIRIIFDLIYTAFISIAPYARDKNGAIEVWYYGLLLLLYNLHHTSVALQGSAMSAFFAQISDPRFGGMYMTLISAIAIIGYEWPISLCLWSVDLLTVKSCPGNGVNKSCTVIIDGFIVENILCASLGFLWYFWYRKEFLQLGSADPSSWIVNPKLDSSEEIVELSTDHLKK